jgi:hypothetical protein
VKKAEINDVTRETEATSMTIHSNARKILLVLHRRGGSSNVDQLCNALDSQNIKALFLNFLLHCAVAPRIINIAKLRFASTANNSIIHGNLTSLLILLNAHLRFLAFYYKL